MSESEVEMFATQLTTSSASNAKFVPLLRSGKQLPLPLAYEIQHQFVRQQQERGAGECAGYKVGLTNQAMQHMCGVDQPVAGQILADRILHQPRRAALSKFTRLGIESELAVRLAKPLPSLPADGDAVELLACIDAVSASFELVDDRDADYATLDACSIVAENSWNRGLVLGPIADPQPFGNLASLKGTLFVDDQPVAHGSSTDVMGGPLAVLAWLSRKANELGYTTAPGQWIATGAIIPTKFPQAGQTFRFVLDGLPVVELELI